MNILSTLVPIVVEKSPFGERSYDIFSRLLKERIIFLIGEINDASSAIICAQLLFLEAESPGESISLYINSPGGVATAGLSIYDTMCYISSPVETYCLGMAASAGSLVLCGGAHGKRFALPNSCIMIHQPLGGVRGQASDIVIHAKEILRLRKILCHIYSKHTGLHEDEVERLIERDNFLSPEEAMAFGPLGLIDAIAANKPPVLSHLNINLTTNETVL
jgi:ATP-dependent Clp protease protease subunit